MMKYYVEPARLLNNGDQASSLVDTSHSVCLNVLRQLGSLALLSSSMFEELGEITLGMSQRTTVLSGKVTSLRQMVNRLNVEQDEVSVDDLGVLQPFKSSVITSTSLYKRPPGLTQLYEECEKIPSLELLNAFRSDERDCRKLYTNPNFFFELWSQQAVEEAERKRPMKKKHKKSQAAVKVRLPESRIEQMKKKTNEYGINIKPTNQDSSNKSPSNSVSPLKSPTNKDEPDISRHCFSESSIQQKNGSSSSPTTIPSCQTSDSAANEDEALPPPPPVPPPLLRGHSQSADNSRGKSIYLVSDFDRNSMWMPPPPPALNVNHPGSSAVIGPVAEECEFESMQAPPLAPVPPPPPPPPPADVSGFVAKREPNVAAALENKSGSGLKRKESRTDLLQSIRTGIQLRKVENAGGQVGGVKKSGVGPGGGALFNVQAIMDMRRLALGNDDDDDDDDDDDADWEN